MYRDFLDYLPLFGIFFAIIITAAIIAVAVLVFFLISKLINKIVSQNEQKKRQSIYNEQNSIHYNQKPITQADVQDDYARWKAEREKQQKQ